jgi:protein-S-isoprenylcysteine O-methyltransferase Ste14
MYLGFALALLGWGLWLGHAGALLVLPAFVLYMNRFQIVPEERMLAQKFGAPYTRYLQQVRRWL